jgi:MinD-like ATPase involved in chromosome partitioning or flagellar assembly
MSERDDAPRQQHPPASPQHSADQRRERPPMPPPPADVQQPTQPLERIDARPRASGPAAHRRPQPPPSHGQPRSWPQPPGPIGVPMPPPPNRSLVDGIQATQFAPPRRAMPRGGWRRAVYRLTFGMVNLGPSTDEQRITALEAIIRTPINGNFRVGVLGKGGVGKTTVAATIGSVFAQLRQGDRVVAVDADTAFGRLGSRVDPKAVGSYWELISDHHLDTFADVRNRVGNNAAGLFVLAGETATARRRVLEPAVYREAASRLNRHFTITIVDCGSSMDSSVMREVLRDLDALIVVSSPWVDGASAAGQTLEWLADHGMSGLLRRTVVVLNDSDGHADKRTRSGLAQQFVTRGQVVVEVPFDSHLRPGGVIDTIDELAPSTRRRFVEIAALIAQHFAATLNRAPRRPISAP